MTVTGHTPKPRPKRSCRNACLFTFALFTLNCIQKNVVKKHITHDDYRNCLLNREE